MNKIETRDSLKHIKAVLSDWDDTKVATFDSCLALFRQFAQHFNYEIPLSEDLIRFWGKPYREVHQGLFPHLESATEHILPFAREVNFMIRPFQGSRKTILSLDELGIIQGIVSSGPKHSILQTLSELLQLHPNIYKIIQAAEDTEVHKPDPSVFTRPLEVLQESGVFPEQVMYIGDSHIDAQAAIARGLMFFAVTSGVTTRERFIDEGIPEQRVLTNIEELPALLERAKR